MIRLEWLLFMQFFMGILMIVFLQKLTQMKKQVDDITKEVTAYISYITEEMNEELEEYPQEKNIILNQNGMEKSKKDEDQNRLIQAVLGEYFYQCETKI